MLGLHIEWLCRVWKGFFLAIEKELVLGDGFVKARYKVNLRLVVPGGLYRSYVVAGCEVGNEWLCRVRKGFEVGVE